MKKRIFCLMLICLLVVPGIVRADVLIEPVDNFYEKNRQECMHVDRYFIVNSESKTLSAKSQPGGKRETWKLESGAQVLIYAAYSHKGAYWGLVWNESYGKNEQAGWVPMEELLLVYDYISFAEDHKNEFYSLKETSDALQAIEADDIVAWTYPESGEMGYNEAIHGFVGEDIELSYGYKDSQGANGDIAAIIMDTAISGFA